jgi:DNA polymerase
LCYPYPKILENQYGPQLTYMTVPTPDDKKKGKVIDDVSNSAKWARVTAYGGSLMQNVAEGVCRDLLVDCMLDMGNFVVLHVHDEIVLEVPEARGEQARAKMQEIMRTPPEWAKGFPLWATCSVMRRYGGK